MSISDDPTEVLPATRAECRALLATLKDELASIKAQIAAVDLERQARGGRLDARWFHRAKTAQRTCSAASRRLLRTCAACRRSPPRCRRSGPPHHGPAQPGRRSDLGHGRGRGREQAA